MYKRVQSLDDMTVEQLKVLLTDRTWCPNHNCLRLDDSCCDRWPMTEISRVLTKFEASFSTPSDTITGRQHEQSNRTQLTYAKGVLCVLATFQDMGNPFIEDCVDMLTLDTEVVMNKDAIRTVNTVEDISQRQFSEFVEDRPKSASNKRLSDIVSNNNSTPQAKQRSRSKEQVACLKTNCTLFLRLYIA